ncbi:MAG: carbohydrate kinase [Dictyoglomi bacterium]|nr:carbohydrate kinase [Dictyoglomota bacterium]
MRVTFIGHLSKDINIMKDKEQIIPGGGVYYGAFVTRSFGAESYVYTKLSSKDTELFKDMESYGIRLVKFTSKVTTTIQNLYPTDNPDDRISKMVERADPFTDEDIKIIEKSDVLHISGLWHGEIPENLIESLREKTDLLGLDAQGFLRNVDESGDMIYKDWQDKERYLPLIDVFKVDSRESEILTGEKDMEKALGKIARFGPKEIILTYKDGIKLWIQGEILEEKFGGWTLEGRTGRGDTCMAGYLVHRHTGYRNALRKTAEIATKKMKRPGPYRKD